MGAKQIGLGYFNINNPTDEEVKARYKKALVEVLAMFENAVKMCVRAEDQTALKSLKNEVSTMFERTELTLKNKGAS